MPVGTIQYGNLLEELVNRALAESEITKTIFRANRYFARVDERSKTITGAWVEFPIYTGETGTAKMFTVYGTSDSATYNPVEKVKMVKMDWKAAADFLRVSKIQLQQASGPEALLNYLQAQVEPVVESLKQLISNQLFTGDGQNDNAWGLDSILRINGPTTSPADNAFGGVARSGLKVLQANIADATDTTDFAGSTDGAMTFTNGSDVVQQGTTGTNDFDPAANLKVGGVLTGPDGRKYIVAYLDTANNQVYIDRPYEGATATNDTTWTYKGRYSNTTVYGNSGELTAEKLNLVMALCTDGSDHPTDLFMNSELFTVLLNEVIVKTRYVGTNNEQIGPEDYLSMYFNGARVYIDNHAPAGKVYVLNAKYGRLVKLRGYSEPRLDRGSLRWDVTGTRIQSLVGEVVCVFAHYIRALNRCGVIQGITV